MDCLIKFIEATQEHKSLLYSWVNDQKVRENSFNSNIVDYENHVNWFNEKLQSKSSIIYICYIEDTPVGQIRIDRINNDIGLINYSVDSKFRGKGIGTSILIRAKDKISQLKLNKLIGKVKKDNIASRKAFLNAGYAFIEEEDYIVFYKEKI